MAGMYDNFWEMQEGGPYDGENSNKIFKCTCCGGETFHENGWGRGAGFVEVPRGLSLQGHGLVAGALGTLKYYGKVIDELKASYKEVVGWK